jgi:hypothetical protein
MLMLLVISATLVVTTTPAVILSPQLAQAKQGKHIQAGGAGELNCPSSSAAVSGGSPLGPELIFFSADRSKGKLFGDWFIQQNVSFQIKAGDITDGHISGKQITLTGTEDTDEVCSSQTPATITITGQCGTHVIIQFKSSNGQEGRFVGDVNCTK